MCPADPSPIAIATDASARQKGQVRSVAARPNSSGMRNGIARSQPAAVVFPSARLLPGTIGPLSLRQPFLHVCRLQDELQPAPTAACSPHRALTTCSASSSAPPQPANGCGMRSPSRAATERHDKASGTVDRAWPDASNAARRGNRPQSKYPVDGVPSGIQGAGTRRSRGRAFQRHPRQRVLGLVTAGPFPWPPVEHRWQVRWDSNGPFVEVGRFHDHRRFVWAPPRNAAEGTELHRPNEDGPLSAFIFCYAERAAPSPDCQMVFEIEGAVVKATFGREYFPEAETIRNDITAFFDCARMPPPSPPALDYDATCEYHAIAYDFLDLPSTAWTVTAPLLLAEYEGEQDSLSANPLLSADRPPCAINPAISVPMLGPSSREGG